MLEALDALLRALELEPVSGDRFRAVNEPPRFEQVFGGQLVAQALRAASATVSTRAPHSLHASFVAAGSPEIELDLEVDRVRDGRSVSMRRVTVSQDSRPLLVALVSFHDNPSDPELSSSSAVADGPRPDRLPSLQDWAREVAPEKPRALRWIDRPPPLEMRVTEAPTFLGGTPAHGPRSHWFRLPREVGSDPHLHAALLSYASDYLLMDMAFRSRPGGYSQAAFTGLSLDHAVWLHRPVRFDQWHRYEQETVAFVGHRGLVRGSIHDARNRLVASVMQEVLVRPTTSR
jgi:acyl-CoA thioesterase-2